MKNVFSLVLLISCVVLWSFTTRSQPPIVGFKITQACSNCDAQQFVQLLNNADFTNYRNLNSNRFLRFTNGATIELYSVIYMNKQGANIKVSESNAFEKSIQCQGEFSIHPSGIVVYTAPVKNKK